jgi:hypothetical protein
MTVTVRDSDRRRRKPLAVHTGVDGQTAHELVRIYRALGYPSECINVDSDSKRDAA